MQLEERDINEEVNDDETVRVQNNPKFVNQKGQKPIQDYQQDSPSHLSKLNNNSLLQNTTLNVNQGDGLKIEEQAINIKNQNIFSDNGTRQQTSNLGLKVPHNIEHGTGQVDNHTNQVSSPLTQINNQILTSTKQVDGHQNQFDYFSHKEVEFENNYDMSNLGYPHSLGGQSVVNGGKHTEVRKNESRIKQEQQGSPSLNDKPKQGQIEIQESSSIYNSKKSIAMHKQPNPDEQKKNIFQLRGKSVKDVGGGQTPLEGKSLDQKSDNQYQTQLLNPFGGNVQIVDDISQQQTCQVRANNHDQYLVNDYSQIDATSQFTKGGALTELIEHHANINKNQPQNKNQNEGQSTNTSKFQKTQKTRQAKVETKIGNKKKALHEQSDNQTQITYGHEFTEGQSIQGSITSSKLQQYRELDNSINQSIHNRQIQEENLGDSKQNQDDKSQQPILKTKNQLDSMDQESLVSVIVHFGGPFSDSNNPFYAQDSQQSNRPQIAKQQNPQDQYSGVDKSVDLVAVKKNQQEIYELQLQYVKPTTANAGKNDSSLSRKFKVKKASEALNQLSKKDQSSLADHDYEYRFNHEILSSQLSKKLDKDKSSSIMDYDYEHKFNFDLLSNSTHNKKQSTKVPQEVNPYEVLSNVYCHNSQLSNQDREGYEHLIPFTRDKDEKERYRVCGQVLDFLVTSVSNNWYQDMVQSSYDDPLQNHNNVQEFEQNEFMQAGSNQLTGRNHQMNASKASANIYGFNLDVDQIVELDSAAENSQQEMSFVQNSIDVDQIKNSQPYSSIKTSAMDKHLPEQDPNKQKGTQKQLIDQVIFESSDSIGKVKNNTQKEAGSNEDYTDSKKKNDIVIQVDSKLQHSQDDSLQGESKDLSSSYGGVENTDYQLEQKKIIQKRNAQQFKRMQHDGSTATKKNFKRKNSPRQLANFSPRMKNTPFGKEYDISPRIYAEVELLKPYIQQDSANQQNTQNSSLDMTAMGNQTNPNFMLGLPQQSKQGLLLPSQNTSVAAHAHAVNNITPVNLDSKQSIEQYLEDSQQLTPQQHRLSKFKHMPKKSKGGITQMLAKGKHKYQISNSQDPQEDAGEISRFYQDRINSQLYYQDNPNFPMQKAAFQSHPHKHQSSGIPGREHYKLVTNRYIPQVVGDYVARAKNRLGAMNHSIEATGSKQNSNYFFEHNPHKFKGSPQTTKKGGKLKKKQLKAINQLQEYMMLNQSSQFTFQKQDSTSMRGFGTQGSMHEFQDVEIAKNFNLQEFIKANDLQHPTKYSKEQYGSGNQKDVQTQRPQESAQNIVISNQKMHQKQISIDNQRQNQLNSPMVQNNNTFGSKRYAHQENKVNNVLASSLDQYNVNTHQIALQAGTANLSQQQISVAPLTNSLSKNHAAEMSGSLASILSQEDIDINETYKLIQAIRAQYGAGPCPYPESMMDDKQKWKQVIKFLEKNPQVLLQLVPSKFMKSAGSKILQSEASYQNSKQKLKDLENNEKPAFPALKADKDSQGRYRPDNQSISLAMKNLRDRNLSTNTYDNNATQQYAATLKSQGGQSNNVHPYKTNPAQNSSLLDQNHMQIHPNTQTNFFNRRHQPVNNYIANSNDQTSVFSQGGVQAKANVPDIETSNRITPALRQNGDTKSSQKKTNVVSDPNFSSPENDKLLKSTVLSSSKNNQILSSQGGTNPIDVSTNHDNKQEIHAIQQQLLQQQIRKNQWNSPQTAGNNIGYIGSHMVQHIGKSNKLKASVDQKRESMEVGNALGGKLAPLVHTPKGSHILSVGNKHQKTTNTQHHYKNQVGVLSHNQGADNDSQYPYSDKNRPFSKDANHVWDTASLHRSEITSGGSIFGQLDSVLREQNKVYQDQKLIEHERKKMQLERIKIEKQLKKLEAKEKLNAQKQELEKQKQSVRNEKTKMIMEQGEIDRMKRSLEAKQKAYDNYYTQKYQRSLEWTQVYNDKGDGQGDASNQTTASKKPKFDSQRPSFEIAPKNKSQLDSQDRDSNSAGRTSAHQHSNRSHNSKHNYQHPPQQIPPYNIQPQVLDTKLHTQTMQQIKEEEQNLPLNESEMNQYPSQQNPKNRKSPSSHAQSEDTSEDEEMGHKDEQGALSDNNRHHPHEQVKDRDNFNPYHSDPSNAANKNLRIPKHSQPVYDSSSKEFLTSAQNVKESNSKERDNPKDVYMNQLVSHSKKKQSSLQQPVLMQQKVSISSTGTHTQGPNRNHRESPLSSIKTFVSNQGQLFDWYQSQIMEEIKTNQLFFNEAQRKQFFSEKDVKDTLVQAKDQSELDLTDPQILKDTYTKAFLTLKELMIQMNLIQLYNKITVTYKTINYENTIKILLRCKQMFQARQIIKETLREIGMFADKMDKIKVDIDLQLDGSLTQEQIQKLKDTILSMPQLVQGVKTKIVQLRDEYKMFTKITATSSKGGQVQNVFVYQRADGLKTIVKEYWQLRKLATVIDINDLPIVNYV